MSSATSASSSSEPEDGGVGGVKKLKKDSRGTVFLIVRVCFVCVNSSLTSVMSELVGHVYAVTQGQDVTGQDIVSGRSSRRRSSLLLFRCFFCSIFTVRFLLSLFQSILSPSA